MSPIDPLSPINTTLATSATPTDWAIGNGSIYWHDGSALRKTPTGGGPSTIFSAESTGAVDVEPGIVYVAEFDGNDDVVHAYDTNGNHLANIASFDSRVVNDGECIIYERPRRFLLANGQLYASTEEISSCNLSLGWGLYRLTKP